MCWVQYRGPHHEAIVQSRDTASAAVRHSGTVAMLVVLGVTSTQNAGLH
jgi:hypothetical protein